MARTVTQNVIEDLTKLSDEKKEEMATLFSEGNEDLKKLLIKMWNNGIQTYACCAGHDESEIKASNGPIPSTNPYIYFDVKTLSPEQQYKLFKAIIKSTKNVKLIEKFSLTLDEYMGFEKHGLTIRMKKDKQCYRYLNDMFDNVFKKENIFDNIKKLLFGENSALSIEEKDFLDSMMQVNGLSLNEYSKKADKFSKTERIERLEINYDKGEKGIDVRDGVRTELCCEDKEEGRFWFNIAEGMYVKDPYEEDVYYTLKNGEQVTLNHTQLSGLKPLESVRKYNFSKKYSYEQVSDITCEISAVASLDL